MCMGDDDAVDEEKLILCQACCCSNCAIYPACDALGVSGKAGICCCNLECCCKCGAPCLFPFGCVGVKCENDGCSIINSQCQVCCVVCTTAIPCNEEVPCAFTIAGLTLYPVQGCCVRQKEIIERMDR